MANTRKAKRQGRSRKRSDAPRAHTRRGAVLELPWYTGASPGEYIAVNGQIVHVPGKDSVFVSVAPELTMGMPGVLPLVSEGLPLGSLPNAPFCLVGKVLADGAVQPLAALPVLYPPRVLIGWLANVVIVAVNLRLLDGIIALKGQIRRNLLDIFELFGVGPQEGAGQDGLSQYEQIMVLKLAIRKKQLDDKTIEAGIEALRECLGKITDADRRAKLSKAIEQLTECARAKGFFDGRILLPTLGEEFNPKDDQGEYSGLPYWDRSIAEAVLERLRRLLEFLEEMIRLRKEMQKLAPGLGEGVADGPSLEELEERLREVKRRYEELEEQFEEEQKEREEELRERIKEACPGGNVELIARELIITLISLLERNERFYDILQNHLDAEEDAIRRARRLLEANKGLGEAERRRIEEAIEREQEAAEQLGDPELRARKLNLLLQFKALIEEQLRAGVTGGGVLDFGDLPEAPETLEGFLGGKEAEVERIREWLESHRDKAEELGRCKEALEELLD